MNQTETQNNKTIMILATGGTIAGIGSEGKNTGYTSGSLSIDSILNEIPQIQNVANIKYKQVCNVNSDDITSEI